MEDYPKALMDQVAEHHNGHRLILLEHFLTQKFLHKLQGDLQFQRFELKNSRYH